MNKHSYNSYYNRRRRALRESRNAAQSVALVFADRLERLCNDLEWLRDFDSEEEWTSESEIRLVNTVKNARALHDLYINDDAFIPEISGTTGYKADETFSVKSAQIGNMEFSDTLEFIADTIEDMIDDAEDSNAWNIMISYIPLVRLFLSQFRKDYSI